MEEDGHTTQPILLQTPTKVLALLRCRVLIFPFFVALIVIGPSPDYVLLYSNGSPVFLFTLSSTPSIEHKLWNHRAGLIYSSVICQSHDHGKSYTFSYFFICKTEQEFLLQRCGASGLVNCHNTVQLREKCVQHSTRGFSISTALLFCKYSVTFSFGLHVTNQNTCFY